jgi:hypothetical protein
MAKKYDPADYMTPFVFPHGIVMYSNMITPDTYEGKTEYRVQVEIGDTQEWKDALQKLQEFQDARCEAHGKPQQPLTCVKTKDGKKFLKFHSGSPDRFSVVDKNNQPTTDEPWGGSTVRIFATPMYYTGFGGGMTLYLTKAMVVEQARDSGGPSNFNDPFASSAPKGDAPADPFAGVN